MASYILAFDLGTSAIKAALVTEDMKVFADTSASYATHFPAVQQAEQYAEDWWTAACTAAHNLFSEYPEAAGKVCAIGVSGHMLGMLPVDAQGEPLMPSLIHADTRAMPQAEHLAKTIGADVLYRRTGNVLGPAATLSKALWLKEKHPEIYGRCAKILQSKDYLNFRMTGNMDSTDYSDASHAMLIDIGRKVYLEDEFRELGLDAARFPELHASADIIGRLQPEAAKALGLQPGIPVVAGGGDGACANVGAGISRTGDTYFSLGTTGWAACNMDEPFLDDRQRVFNILSLDPSRCSVFGTVQSVGHSITWAQSLLSVDGVGELNRLAAQVNPGCDGLIYLPYLEGERSPIFDPLARGVFFGMTPQHGRSHFARAVFEGVSYALVSIIEILRERIPVTEVRSIGGGANSDLWMQILADAGQLRIHSMPSASAATALGAAAAAGVAAGVFDSIDSATVKISSARDIEPDQNNHGVYARNMELYQSLYPLLKPAFHAAGANMKG